MVKRKVIFKKKAPQVVPDVRQAPPTVMHQMVTTVVQNNTAPQMMLVQRTKFRRLKDKGVTKEPTKDLKHLRPAERDTIIRWWNTHQQMVPKEDPVCARIATELNAHRRISKLGSMQVSGYFSYLCRLGLWTESRRQKRIAKHLRRGQYSVAPVYGPAFIQAIQRNWEQQRADEIQRAQAHVQLRQARAQGQRLRIVASVAGQARVVMTPALATPTEEQCELTFAG